MKLHKFKNWATPITIGAFAIMAVTGVLMFFNIRFGLLQVAHEWMGLVMVFGVIFHIVGNFKAFMNYFKKPVATVGIAILVVAGASSFFMTRESGRGGNPIYSYVQTMEGVSLDLASQIVKTEPGTLKQKLEAKGYKVENTTQTINEIAASNNAQFFDVLGVVLEKGNAETEGK